MNAVVHIARTDLAELVRTMAPSLGGSVEQRRLRNTALSLGARIETGAVSDQSLPFAVHALVERHRLLTAKQLSAGTGT